MDRDGDSRYAQRRAEYKRLRASDNADRRRAAALARQSDARSDAFQQVRLLHADAEASEPEDEPAAPPAPAMCTEDVLSPPGSMPAGGMEEDAPSGAEKRECAPTAPTAQRRWFASQLQVPEWMTSIPFDLNGTAGGGEACIDAGEGWSVCPRPEGQQVLIVASGGATHMRDRHGNVVVGRFQSTLPGGNARSSRGEHGTVIEGVFTPAGRAVYMTDLLLWNGTSYLEYPADFRRFWLLDHVASYALSSPSPCVCDARFSHEASVRVISTPPFDVDDDVLVTLDRVYPDAPRARRPRTCTCTHAVNEFRMLPLPAYDCDSAGLSAAYSHTFEAPHAKDGLIFYRKAGRYTPGATPLVLRWRDAATSALESPTRAPFIAVLEIAPSLRFLRTHDEEEVAVIPPEVVSARGLHASQLVQVHTRGVDVSGARPELVAPALLGPYEGHRMHADTWSKILHRSTPGLSIVDIANVVARVVVLPPPPEQDDAEMVEDDAHIRAAATAAGHPLPAAAPR